MTEQELIALTIAQTDGYLDYPFNRPNQKAGVIFSVIKHQSNNKMIAMVYTKSDQLFIDVKLLPQHSESLRLLKGVMPGQHLNNHYWTTINVTTTELSQTELVNVIAESAKLTG